MQLVNQYTKCHGLQGCPELGQILSVGANEVEGISFQLREADNSYMIGKHPIS